MNAGLKAGLIVAALFIPCCGGITTIAAFAGDDEDRPKVFTTGTPASTPSTTLAVTTEAPTPTTAAATTPSVVATTSRAPAAVYYQNCDEVTAAGEAPLTKSEPGYRKALDRDGDGVACESDDSPPDTDEDTSVYYKNCTAVRAAGAAPIHRGEPGYGKHLDRDGDGIACE